MTGKPWLPHPNVLHPHALIPQRPGINDWVARVASSVLGSMLLFWITFLVPLLVIPLPDSVKLIVSIVFSSWFQAWALPVLQGAANRAQQARDAKADVDHEALTSLHHTCDAILAAVTAGSISRPAALNNHPGKDPNHG